MPGCAGIATPDILLMQLFNGVTKHISYKMHACISGRQGFLLSLVCILENVWHFRLLYKVRIGFMVVEGL